MTLKKGKLSLENKYRFNDDDIVYTLVGDPIPLARVRFGQHRAWDSQKQLKVTSEITLVAQHGNRPKYSGPLRLNATFYMVIPPSRERKSKPGYPHAVKPDLDNLVKYICDVAQKVLFENDSRIAEINCKKIYSKKPRTEFIIQRLENNEEI
jgi:Holliday junction resolvase RusA-like endonuclease